MLGGISIYDWDSKDGVEGFTGYNPDGSYLYAPLITFKRTNTGVRKNIIEQNIQNCDEFCWLKSSLGYEDSINGAPTTRGIPTGDSKVCMCLPADMI